MDYGRTIVKMQFGSHVYGTNLPTSDTDFKAVHVPTASDILLQRAKGSILTKTNTGTERNTAADVDFESFSLQRFMGLLLEGQTVALNMLFTPDQWILETSLTWLEIRSKKHLWLHSGIKAFIGYCRQQSSKYGIRGSRVAACRETIAFLDGLLEKHGNLTKLKEVWDEIEAFAANREHVSLTEGVINETATVRMLDVCNRKVQEFAPLWDARQIFQKVFDNYGQRALAAERNEGVDWKAVMHAVRACGEAEELLTRHTITYPRPEAELLLVIRKGALAYSEVSVLLEERMERLERLMLSSTLPKEPDHGAAERLVLEVYRGAVGFSPL